MQVKSDADVLRNTYVDGLKVHLDDLFRELLRNSKQNLTLNVWWEPDVFRISINVITDRCLEILAHFLS